MSSGCSEALQDRLIPIYAFVPHKELMGARIDKLCSHCRATHSVKGQISLKITTVKTYRKHQSTKYQSVTEVKGKTPKDSQSLPTM